MSKPTLADLDNPDYKPDQPQPTPPAPPANTPPTSPANTPPPAPPIKDGDGTKPIVDLQNQPPPPQKTAEEIAAENVAKGLNPDGSAKTPEQIGAEKKAADDAAADDENDLQVWSDVDKIWGRELEVTYKNAAGEDVHPNSPEGIHLREQAIASRALQDFDAYLEKSDPRAYAYILHRQAGGTDEDFFAKKTVTLPVYEEFQNSVDLQSRVVAEDLRLRGVPEKIIKLTVDEAVKDKSITAMAEDSYKRIQKAEQEEIDRLNKANAEAEKAYNRSVQVLNKALQDEMKAGMKIIVPEAKRQQFDTFIRERIEYTGQGFVFSLPIEQKALPTLLDTLYYFFAGGNMNEVVQRTAQTQNVARLKRHAAAAATGSRPTSHQEPVKHKLTLGEL